MIVSDINLDELHGLICEMDNRIKYLEERNLIHNNMGKLNNNIVNELSKKLNEINIRLYKLENNTLVGILRSIICRLLEIKYEGIQEINWS